MSVVYSLTSIDDRLTGTVTAINSAGNGYLRLQTSSGLTVSNVQLNRPSGVVSNGVLSFTGTLLDPSAAATGFASQAIITDTNGAAIVSGLSVGTSSYSPATDITLSNGLGNTLITQGQVIQFLSGQVTITGA